MDDARGNGGVREGEIIVFQRAVQRAAELLKAYDVSTAQALREGARHMETVPTMYAARELVRWDLARHEEWLRARIAEPILFGDFVPPATSADASLAFLARTQEAAVKALTEAQTTTGARLEALAGMQVRVLAGLAEATTTMTALIAAMHQETRNMTQEKQEMATGTGTATLGDRMLETAADEGGQVVALVTGKQAAKRIATAILQHAKKRRVPASMLKWATAALGTEVGLGVFALVLGTLAPAIPAITRKPWRTKLVSGMRVWGGFAITDGAADPLLDAILGSLDDLGQELETESAGLRS